MSFKDHFSGHAANYAQFRPHYPEALFVYLASLTPEHEHAWDCATGNGQAALALAGHFHRVTATDASAEQIQNAQSHAGIDYRVAPAEQSGLEESSLDLVTVAQALHWFDTAVFAREALRVLKPNGIIAAWAYNLLTVSPEIDAVLLKFYQETTGPCWPPERGLVESGYRTVEFPFVEVTTPPMHMEAHWTRAQLLGYLRTWSATQNFIAQRGFDPVESLGVEIERYWRDDEPRLLEWPLSLRVGRKA